MKRNFFLLLGVIVTFSFYLLQSEKQDIYDLTLSNLEALAQGEGATHRLCVGSGSLDCHGDKVRLIFDNFSLGLN